MVDAAAAVGVSWTSLYSWLHARGTPPRNSLSKRCWRCDPRELGPPDPGAYAHLLGLYLGDGSVARARRGVFVLRIACADSWPGLADECEQTIRSVVPNKVHRVASAGCHHISAASKHWPCLLPQHGSGRKHDRRILLLPWQREIVTAHPGRLLRGLFHSDGWRGTNVAVVRRHGVLTRYRYPRYEFTNRSADIHAICRDALDLLGIAWRPTGPTAPQWRDERRSPPWTSTSDRSTDRSGVAEAVDSHRIGRAGGRGRAAGDDRHVVTG